MTAPPTLLLTDPLFLEHDPGQEHPESPSRLARIVDDLRQRPVAGTTWAAPRPAEDSELVTVHEPQYLASLAALSGRHALLDEDTMVSPRSWDAARLAAGAAVQAVEEVWAGRAANAFVLARPPGHHAEVDRAMGFCLINNAAVGAEAARRAGAARVAIVDWDVHHGNGTQHLFDRRADVLFVSTHQAPLYPGTGAPFEVGAADGAGLTVNCPLPPGQDDADYGAVFSDIVLPAVERFAPDLVIVSAGFDAHARDPLAQMNLTERGFAAMCAAVLALVPRGVLLLEGGYDLDALAASVRACVEVMTGRRETFPAGGSGEARRAIAATRAAHAGAARSPLASK
jgi:acetoin utilization deacetylase AcuC-like enzyme